MKATVLLPTIAVVLLLGAVSVGSAAAKSPQGKVFDDWAIECEQPAGAKDEKCFITQYAIVNKEGSPPQRLMKLSVGHLGPKGEVVAVGLLPLGISIPTGVAYKIDDRAQHAMLLQSCGPEGCVATAPLDGDTVTAMERGKTMAVGALPQGSSQTMSIPVSLKGFKAALAALE